MLFKLAKISISCVTIISIGIVGASKTYALDGSFDSTSYNSSISFTDRSNTTPMGIAFDGSNYWSVSGGSSGGVREARYNSSGSLLSTYSPGLDFRSIFTNASGTVYARQYNNNQIYQQTTPGVFSSILALTGGILNEQSSVVLDIANNQYIAMNAGTVSRWNTSGNYLGTVSLSGFGSQFSENSSPNNRGIAVADGYWLTYSNGNLSAWNPTTGSRLSSTQLVGAGTDFNAGYSFSYANNMAFVRTDGNWNGYNVEGASAAVPWNFSPEQGVALGLPIFFGLRVLKKRIGSKVNKSEAMGVML